MSWKASNEQALEALMDGNNQEAIRLWKLSVKSIEETKQEGSVEIGQIYYYLGKCLSDAGLTDEAIQSMLKAESILSPLDPDSETLRQCKYHLGAALRLTGDEGAATTRFRDALGLVERDLPALLQGDRKEDLQIEDAVAVLRKEGLAKELTKKELSKIHKHLVEIGRADEDEIDSVHPFDVLFEYYENNESRKKNDKCMTMEWFDLEEDLKTVLEKLNELLDMTLFTSEDLAIVSSESEKHWYIIVDKDEEGPVAAPVANIDGFTDLIEIYNSKLMLCDDDRRFFRLSSYDDRNAVYLLDIKRAVSLFKKGTQYIFEDLPSDLEPTPPDLVRLSE
jgi:hypothetical protein